MFKNIFYKIVIACALLTSSSMLQAQQTPVGADSVAVNVQPDAEEFNILKELFEKTEGREWKRNRNWLKGKSSIDFAKWFGVTVEQGDVVEIDLTNNNLTGSIPPSLYKLRRLRSVSVANNNLKEQASEDNTSKGTKTARSAASESFGITPLLSGTQTKVVSGKNLPMWGLAVAGPKIQDVDWRNYPPVAHDLPNSTASTIGTAGVAIDDCGRLAFYALHSGQDIANRLHIFSEDGTRLTNEIAGDPKLALNSVPGNTELQIVRVPGTSNEWYLIYSYWYGTSCASASSGYCASKVAYSRVSYDVSTGIFNIIVRDQLLPTTNTYIHGKAVSNLYFDNPAIGPYHYLYLAKRAANDQNMSVSRFKIHATGIDSEQLNAVPFTVEYWSLSMAGSSITLTQDGNTLAISNRNDVSSFVDFIIFDLTKFDLPGYAPETINAKDLMLTLDWQGQTIHKTITELYTSEPYKSVFDCWANFDRKLSNIEFSPSGRYLYAVHGGSNNTSALTYNTYLIQIDLQSNNGAAGGKDVRVQVQSGGQTTGCTGPGGSWAGPNNHSLYQIESAYDGRIYFTKLNKPYLYVLPNPDDLMPQDLTPRDIDLSKPGIPNVLMNSNANVVFMPENIDGFEYLKESNIQNFALNKISVAVGSPVKLTLLNYSASNIYQVSWGDEVLQMLTSATTTHKYTAVGNYKIILTTTGPDNCAIKTSLTIEVVPCEAITDININSSNLFCAVKFTTKKLVNCRATYAWNFGDGTTSSERNPIHSYGAQGTYHVTLAVAYDCSGCTGNRNLSTDIVFTPTPPEIEQVSIQVDTDQRFEVITSSASSFADGWLLDHNDDALDNKVPFLNGSQGVWRNDATYVFEKDRKLSEPVNIAKDGTYTLEQFNWKYADLNAVPNWIMANEMTRYSPYSYELENEDVLGIKSAAIYDHDGQLPVANGVNMRNDEMAFSSFESANASSPTQLKTSGNWVLGTNPLPQYTTYKIIRARDHQAIVEATMEQLENVTKVDIESRSLIGILLRKPLSYIKDNEIVCKSPNPANPNQTIVVLKISPHAGHWLGKLRFKNQVVPLVVGERDNAVAHSGSYSMKITADKTFKQEYLRLSPGKSYFLNSWVSKNNASLTTPILGTGIGIDIVAKLKNGQTISTFTFQPAGPLIEGWQQIRGSFICPPLTAYIEVTFKPGTAGTVWFDDLRLHPENGNMKSYVYDSKDFRLKAILDEENFASYFYYDKEGNLYLTKKETKDGIKTISENMSYQVER